MPLNKKQRSNYDEQNDNCEIPFEASETEVNTPVATSRASTRASVNTDAVVKLYITFPNGTTQQGSAFLYGTNALATAGHCIYDPRYGGKARSIRAVFSDGTEEKVLASKLFAPKKWLAATTNTMSNLWEYDYGVIQLKGTPGRTLGYLDYLIPSDSRLDRYIADEKEVHVVGYEAGYASLSDYTGPVMMYDDDCVGYDATFISGQSGGPVILDGTDSFIAIANYGASGKFDYPTGARISNTIADFLDLYY